MELLDSSRDRTWEKEPVAPGHRWTSVVLSDSCRHLAQQPVLECSESFHASLDACDRILGAKRQELLLWGPLGGSCGQRRTWGLKVASDIRAACPLWGPGLGQVPAEPLGLGLKTQDVLDSKRSPGQASGLGAFGFQPDDQPPSSECSHGFRGQNKKQAGPRPRMHWL